MGGERGGRGQGCLLRATHQQDTASTCLDCGRQVFQS